MTHQDVGFAARLHADQLPHGLFPRLGTRFLHAYYRSYVDSPYAVALVTPDDRPAGYLVGTTDQQAHHRWMVRQKGLRLGLLGAIGLATHPGALWLFLRTRLGRYARGLFRAVRPNLAVGQAHALDAATAEEGAPVGVLMHVAVSPDARGRGHGRRLTQVFTGRAREAGCHDLRLVTRAEDGAGPFYESLGWQFVGNRRHAESLVAEYRFPISESAPS